MIRIHLKENLQYQNQNQKEGGQFPQNYFQTFYCYHKYHH